MFNRSKSFAEHAMCISETLWLVNVSLNLSSSNEKSLTILYILEMREVSSGDVLPSFVSTCHKLELSERREPRLRKMPP